MKKLVLLVLFIITLSCGEGDGPKKPERLLSKDEMANIIYDISMVQAIRSSKPQLLDGNDIKPRNYIFKKYKIDSATFAQNNTWYAADMEVYEAIHKKVSERIKKEREAFAPKKDTTKISTPTIADARAKRDSLRKVALDKQQLQKK